MNSFKREVGKKTYNEKGKENNEIEYFETIPYVHGLRYKDRKSHTQSGDDFFRKGTLCQLNLFRCFELNVNVAVFAVYLNFFDNYFFVRNVVGYQFVFPWS